MADKYYFFWHGFLSQWFRSPFTIDGVTYNCAEQYMMAEKARFFKDDEALKEIMKAVKPSEQKAWGRRVKNFIEHQWNAVARDVVHKGNIAKFTQNTELREKLLATEGLLVEASPQDAIWGIGMDEFDKNVLDTSRWGKNWLGETLTKVREELKAAKP